MIASFLLNLIGVFISGFSSIFFNLPGINRSNPSYKSNLNIIMLILGVFSSLISIIFVIILQCTISLKHRRVTIENSSDSSSSINNLPNYELYYSNHSNSISSNNNENTSGIRQTATCVTSYSEHYNDPPPSYNSVCHEQQKVY